jgi:WD40 repeat protein
MPALEPLWRQTLADDGRAIALNYSADGRRLATGNSSGQVSVRDSATGGLLHEGLAGLASEVKAVALSPDGRSVAWCVASHIYLWGLPSPGAAEPIAHHSMGGRTFFLSVAFHPSGDFFATVNGDGKADYWDARTGAHRQAFDWGVGKLQDIAFDPTGDRAACSAKTGEIVVWDVDR